MEIQNINTHELTRGRLEVWITRVESPLLFWVQLKNGQRDLIELIEELNFRMDRRSHYLHCWPEDLREDEPCAIQIKNIWQRGLIIRIDTATSMVKISLRDWGMTVWKPMGQVYLLEDRFRELPWQSIKCGLAHTGPVVRRATEWPEKTRLLCKILGDRQEGWIQIIHPLGEREAMVKLMIYNENTEGAHNLRDSLIQLGHARLIDDAAVDVFPHLQNEGEPLI